MLTLTSNLLLVKVGEGRIYSDLLMVLAESQTLAHITLKKRTYFHLVCYAWFSEIVVSVARDRALNALALKKASAL